MRQGSSPARFILVGPLLVAIAGLHARAADSALPDSRLGYRTAPLLLLLSRPDVRADLGLNDDQAASAERAIRSMYVQAGALKHRPNDVDTIRARRAIDQAMQGWIDSRLSAEQKARLIQIDLQWEGPSSLVSRPIVAEALDLSVEQVKRLEEAVKRRDLARSKGHPDADSTLAETSLSTLGEPQREGWKQMMGKPIQFRGK